MNKILLIDGDEDEQYFFLSVVGAKQAQDSVICHLVTNLCRLKKYPKTQWITSLFYL